MQVLIAISQLLNTFHGNSAYEMLSSHAWKLRNESSYWGTLQLILDRVIFFWWKTEGMDHCQWCYESEQERCKGLSK